MYKVRFLPHIADIRMNVAADTEEEIFKGAVGGMSELMKKKFCNQKHSREIKSEIVIHSADITNLLIDFLNEVLSLSHINKAIYCTADIIKLTPTDLSVTLKGYYTNEWDEDIKAVTYHEAELKKINNKWNTRIIFDI